MIKNKKSNLLKTNLYLLASSSSNLSKNQPSKRLPGFTIVELLIVIVVIGILASISIVAYNGIQGRARDTQRINDMQTIVKALEIYKINHGNYPPTTSTPLAGGWEISHNGARATDFLSDLIGESGVSSIPIDPKNSALSTGSGTTYRHPGTSFDNWVYFYYRYDPGTHGCDPSRGHYYVLGVARMDGVASGEISPDSPGFSCTNRTWQQGAWLTGDYVN